MGVTGCFIAGETGMSDSGNLNVTDGVYDWVTQPLAGEDATDLSFNLVVLLRGPAPEGDLKLEVTCWYPDGDSLAMRSQIPGPMLGRNLWSTVAIPTEVLTAQLGLVRLEVRPVGGGTNAWVELEVRAAS